MKAKADKLIVLPKSLLGDEIYLLQKLYDSGDATTMDITKLETLKWIQSESTPPTPILEKTFDAGGNPETFRNSKSINEAKQQFLSQTEFEIK